MTSYVSISTTEAEAPVPAAPAAPAAAAPADSIADPGPLGLAAFATTTFVLSVFNAGLLDSALEPVVFGLALFFGGAVQLLAGMWEFKKANTFGAVAFSAYGAFWLAFWYWADIAAPGVTSADKGKAAGLFLLAFTIFTLYMTVASLRTSGALAATFVVLTITFVLLTAGHFVPGGEGLVTAGGWTGLLTAFLAWYVSFAGVVASTFKRSVLPTFPLG